MPPLCGQSRAPAALRAPRESLVVGKRVLIEGEGLLGEARLDQRANSPGMRLRRSCWLRNLDLDMTGFREAVCIEGGPSVQPLLSSCILRYLLPHSQVPEDEPGMRGPRRMQCPAILGVFGQGGL